MGNEMNDSLYRGPSWSVPRWARGGLLSPILAFFATAFLGLLVSGCAVSWVGNYDKESVDRTTEISKSVLKLYQDLIATAPDKRAAAVAGPLHTLYGDIESQIRLHLLREQARAKNTASTNIADNLLESWRKFSANHRSNANAALRRMALT